MQTFWARTGTPRIMFKKFTNLRYFYLRFTVGPKSSSPLKLYYLILSSLCDLLLSLFTVIPTYCLFQKYERCSSATRGPTSHIRDSGIWEAYLATFHSFGKANLIGQEDHPLSFEEHIVTSTGSDYQVLSTTSLFEIPKSIIIRLIVEICKTRLCLGRADSMYKYNDSPLCPLQYGPDILCWFLSTVYSFF
jgi:hypothetical protein